MHEQYRAIKIKIKSLEKKTFLDQNFININTDID